jgi:hypothetical protein
LVSGLSNPDHLLFLLALIVFWVAPAHLAGRIARSKERSFGVYFVAGLLIGPISLLAALILPNRRPLAEP